ncbi:MAG: DNA mismatch repair endonuclease MutL [Deltaproteobacteria bacterium]|nr:DNA mismatch repair endonuclease MutL [Deltaproteobacteria bacterium]
MSPKIKILPSELVDQIAAGEVVERPASVVKELVENSLDAGSSRVTCRVEEGGRKLVNVIDNGLGMDRDDLVLACTRHATSKIIKSSDLERIVTLGFRGEALSSIAAVSRMTITTRRKEDKAGTRLTIAGGSRAELVDVGAPVGTDVKVEDLFFNTPARRKFLRTTPTEMTHIQTWISRLGLARSNVHLILQHAKRTLLDAQATDDPAQRTAAILGRQVFEHLYPVDYTESGIRISGLLSDPEHTRSNPRNIYLFVNGRFVRDRLLQHALLSAYLTVIPHGRYPLVVLDLHIDHGSVDVNVHPQKTEVRFSDTNRVHRALSSAVADVLARAPWMKSTRTYLIKSQSTTDSTSKSQSADRVRDALARYHTSIGKQTSSFGLRAKPAQKATEAARPAGEDLPLSELKLLGTLWNTYIFLAAPDGLLVVDQHAAAERITFERLRQQFDNRKVASQRMLVPVQLNLDGAALAGLERYASEIADMGFEVEPFGPTTVNITAVPALLAHVQPTALLLDVLDEFTETGRDTSGHSARLEVIGRMACHASVRAGKALPEAEIRELLRQLEQVDFAGTCPHGRPVLVRFEKSEVAHWFHRT